MAQVVPAGPVVNNLTHRRVTGARLRTAPRERGQALIFGLFALIGGLVALFFLFNTGQLTAEKTKLVNTADAVAYSAGVMHARALNFGVYTNRALMANEVMIAQAVSMASWTTYVSEHSQSAQTVMNCRNQYAVPVALLLFTYVPACYALGLPPGARVAQMMSTTVPYSAQAVVAAAELAKSALQAAQVNMAVDLYLARRSLMQEVADANYANDGAVHIDSIPLTDDFGINGANFITRYADNDRAALRMPRLQPPTSISSSRNGPGHRLMECPAFWAIKPNSAGVAAQS